MELQDHELEVLGCVCAQKGWKLQAEAEQLRTVVENAHGSGKNRRRGSRRVKC
jgi:hypothetical protein